MKTGIHPQTREVLFHDVGVDKYFLIRSTVSTTQTKKWEDGNTYPYYVLDVSSASHPFYTGKQKMLDSGGRVKKFQDRFGASGASKPKAKKAEANAEEAAVEEIAEDIGKTVRGVKTMLTRRGLASADYDGSARKEKSVS